MLNLLLLKLLRHVVHAAQEPSHLYGCSHSWMVETTWSMLKKGSIVFLLSRKAIVSV